MVICAIVFLIHIKENRHRRREQRCGYNSESRISDLDPAIRTVQEEYEEGQDEKVC